MPCAARPFGATSKICLPRCPASARPSLAPYWLNCPNWAVSTGARSPRSQASQTRKSHIKDAFRRLRMAGVMPCGVVLTKTTAQNTAYYTYDNYYGYGVDSPPKAGAAAGAGTRTEPSLTAT